jgi:hypothetical protein
VSTLERTSIPSVATKASTNGSVVALDASYAVEVVLVGTAPILFHRWDDASVERKAKAAKNSQTKRSDDVESYVYRTSDGEIGIPAKNFKACLREAGRSLPDPRSPRKSARDLVQSTIQIEPFISSLGRTSWDVLDVQRVVVLRTAVSRKRPMFQEGWKVGFDVVVLAPEYVSPDWLHDLISRAGRFVGLGDFRPDYGRFRMDSFQVKELL